MVHEPLVTLVGTGAVELPTGHSGSITVTDPDAVTAHLLGLCEDGLLRHPEIAILPYRHDYPSGLLAACDEAEQTGATPHVSTSSTRP